MFLCFFCTNKVNILMGTSRYLKQCSPIISKTPNTCLITFLTVAGAWCFLRVTADWPERSAQA